MSEQSATKTVVVFNDTIDTQDNTNDDSSMENVWVTRNASLLTTIAVNTVVTLIFCCIFTICLLKRINRKSQQREARDKLSDIVQNYYWNYEDEINQVVKLIYKMRDVTIFREVSELHLLAYIYRSDCGVYGQRGYASLGIENKLSSYQHQSSTNAFAVIKKVERLFESLAMKLPCKGECPKNIVHAFSGVLYNLAQSTSALWCDHKSRLVRNLVFYFVGQHAADRFEASLCSDEELETIILARVPYVNLLYLNYDYFVLKDVEISNDLKIDLRNKIRYVDTVLAKNGPKLQVKEKNLTESYYAAREVCLKNSFISDKNHLPDIVSKVGEASKASECVGYLRHLLRVMCNTKNLKRLENDDKFFQFLMQLHETLYSWGDASTMVEVIERSRNNIYSYLRGLTVEQIIMDKEYTKAKLEHVEKELYRHLNYLTLKQVQQEKEKRNPHLQMLRAEDMKLKSVESESSIYTMAMSASSYMMRKQASLDRDRGDFEHLHQQKSLDQSSLLSGSSLYATAASLSSTNENVPLMAQQSSPGREHPERQQSPSSTEGGDYIETAV